MLPRVIGHRGAAAVAPENTIAGIEAAAEAGVSWVEFDVRLTADDVPVMLHDETLRRTTGDRRPLGAVPYREIAALDAGAWFSPRFIGEPLATLDAALGALARLGLGGNVEIKPDRARAGRVARAVIDSVNCHSAEGVPPVLISSLDERMLAAIRHIDGNVPLALVLRRRRRGWRRIAGHLGCVTLHCRDTWIGRGDVERFRAAGFGVAVFTVNDPARAAELIGFGALGVFTDRPGDLIRRLSGPAECPAA